MPTKSEARYACELTHNTARARAEMIRLSSELHGGNIALNASEYEMFSTNAPGREFVSRRWGAWKNFVEFCGLELREAQYYYDMAAERRAEWEALKHGPRLSVAEQRKIEQAATMAGSGLTVKSTPRIDTWRSGGRTWQGLAWEVI